ncbi:MAG: two-component system response regulator [Gammaproteobacteria bacterium]
MSDEQFNSDIPGVLVVEDDEPTRLLLRVALEGEGYRVEEAGNGSEALRCFERFSPDLVLMDALLPVMDGFTACAQLREIPGAASIPVLIITGLDDEESVNRAFECGASDYVHKPIRWSILRQRMRRMLTESRARFINHIAHLTANTDITMDQAKEHGRNNYQFYTPDVSTRALRLALVGGLRHALDRNEFMLHYQPQIDLVSGAMIGVEALIRWKHPELGLVPASDFIPLAEDTGMILPIGKWVVRTACAQYKTWRDAGLPAVRVSVNLSGRQFRQQNLVEIIHSALLETGVTPTAFGVEITESVIMRSDAKTKNVLWDLHHMGVHLSLDDFGTRYSSLRYLKSLPIDVLKIDRSFVSDVTRDPDDAAIATAIIAMAHCLKMGVIAEGVETREELQFLRQQGCDAAQGYLLGKPMPGDVAGLLHSGTLMYPSSPDSGTG